MIRVERFSTSGSSLEIRITPRALGGELVDERVDLRLGADVDAARGLVEDQHPAARRQPLRQHQLLLVAAGEAGGHARPGRARARAGARNSVAASARSAPPPNESQRATAVAESAASCCSSAASTAPGPAACDLRERARGRRASPRRGPQSRSGCPPTSTRPCAAGSSPKSACAISERPAPTSPAKPSTSPALNVKRDVLKLSRARQRLDAQQLVRRRRSRRATGSTPPAGRPIIICTSARCVSARPAAWRRGGRRAGPSPRRTGGRSPPSGASRRRT